MKNKVNSSKEIKLMFVLPTLVYQEAIVAYKQEFIQNGDSMDGTAGLADTTDIAIWIQLVGDNTSEETVRRGFVPASTYLVVRPEDNVLIGMVNIRHRLNDYLFNYGGHVGYSVRKSERQKGYGMEILTMALEECRKLNINQVLVTCNEENLPSAKIIENNGGVLENQVQKDGQAIKRYWITL